VRKAQGGSRYLDWLHAVLHKLEGDFRNAKMWYTDLGNNNSVAENEENQLDIQGKLTKAQNFRRFHQFGLYPLPTEEQARGSRQRLSTCSAYSNFLETCSLQRMGLRILFFSPHSLERLLLRR